MSDPLRTDDPRPLDATPPVDREEKIEQLLLNGLEHYFAAEYEQAINIWTRALFIDRGHARARAYIERARSAQAERQRESEELLQRGVTAFQQGAADEARRLLHDAMAQGAPAEEALAVLERIDRLERLSPEWLVAGPQPLSVPPAVGGASRRAWFALAGCGAVIVAAAAFAAGAFRADLRPLLVRPIPPSAPIARIAGDREALIPRRGEDALVRARVLAQSGRLREALTALDGVRPTDLQKNDADRLRADLQRQLIGMALATPPPRATAEP